MMPENDTGRGGGRGKPQGAIDEVWVKTIITEHLETFNASVDEKFQRLGATMGFQTLFERAADNLAAIATPLRNMAPQRAELDEQQRARLERIASELTRPEEDKPYLDDMLTDGRFS
jgi:hypothetical protein